jgi:hypothetical protein
MSAELINHRRRAAENPKSYFRDDWQDWGAKAEPNAVRCEAQARDCRLRGDDVGAARFEAEAREWRTLVRCR